MRNSILFLSLILIVSLRGHAQEGVPPVPTSPIVYSNESALVSDPANSDDVNFSYTIMAHGFAQAALPADAELSSQDIMGSWSWVGYAPNPLDVSLQNITDILAYRPDGLWPMAAGADYYHANVQFSVQADVLGNKNLVLLKQYTLVSDHSTKTWLGPKLGYFQKSSAFFYFSPGQKQMGYFYECRLLRYNSVLICATRYVDPRFKVLNGMPLQAASYDMYVREKNLKSGK